MTKIGKTDVWERVEPPFLGVMRWRMKPAVYRAATARLNTLEGRMEWLLRLAVADLDRLTDSEWVELFVQAVTVGGGTRGYFSRRVTKVDDDVRGLLRTAHHELAHLFKAVVEGRHFIYTWGGKEGTLGTLDVAATFSVQRVDNALHRSFRGPLPFELVVAATDMLERLGVHRLRQCPLRETPTARECGRLFIATRRQRYCSRQHATRAAWIAWLVRHHGAGAKPPTSERRKAKP